jgi:Superinfection immunity protein
LTEALIIAAATALYFLPLIIALCRRIPAEGIAVMSVLLGWTVTGWLVGLLMACRRVPRGESDRN